MIVHDVAQGSADWFRVRMAIPTSSCFDQIITPKTGQLSASAAKYAYKLIAERLLNRPMQTLDGLQWIERGKLLEPQAVQQYEFTTEYETKPVGFITTDDGLIGASPDRLVVGKAIGVEIKCTADWTHIGYLLEGPGAVYRPQVQGQLMVAELERVDFYAYHDRMPAALIQTYRDEPYIALMRAALAEFNDRMAAMIDKAKALGVFQAYPSVNTPREAADADNLAERIIEQGWGG